MSKNRNTNKVRKALKRKRDRLWHGAKPTRSAYGRGKAANDQYQAALRTWNSVHSYAPVDPRKNNTGGGGGSGGGSGGGDNKPEPKTSQPAGEGQGTLTDTSGTKEAPKQEIELGETFTPNKANVERKINGII